MNTAASSNGRGSHAWYRPWVHINADRRSPGYCRITFDNPPVNTITATTVAELAELIELVKDDADLNVVVFDSANPDFYLTDRTEYDAADLQAWPDLLVDLSRAPVLSIASIRGRACGTASEFVLSCDLRFASRENALLGQIGVGPGASGGPVARLSRLVGRGRALEIALVAGELDGQRAERYGYVNRAIADAELDDEVDEIASRVACIDHEAIARTKATVGIGDR
jgi:enoyl-CoA hydratase/carnithine racemase